MRRSRTPVASKKALASAAGTVTCAGSPAPPAGWSGRFTVTSVDWAGYPILEMPDAPESIEVVMVNRPDQSAGGAGEPAHVTVPAALANAFFDATGVRLRRMPMTAENVRQALKHLA